MSDTHDDPLPNPAALDELLRAFAEGDDESSVDKGSSDDADDGGDPTAPSNPPLELHIVEQTPLEPVPPEPEAAAAPKIIRIDDILGQPHVGAERAESIVAPDQPSDRDIAVTEGDESEPAIIRIDDLDGSGDVSAAADRSFGAHPPDVSSDVGETVDPTGPGASDDDDDDHDVVVVADAVAVGAVAVGDGDGDGDLDLDDETDIDNDTDIDNETDVDDTDDTDITDRDDSEDIAPIRPTDTDDAERTVISIADEELPDAVYVEGNLERSGTRKIVFIEDDDTGDTVATDPKRDARRGIEPRLRERRAAVKRAIGRKRLRWILVVAAVAIIGVATLAVLGSNLFAIRAENVTVIGDVYTDSSELEAVVDDLVGTPILLADTQAAEERLEAIPWVDSAKIRTEFPSSATIEIREREAMTTYQGQDQRYRVLDREGRVLDVLDGWPIAYVLLTGPDPVDLDAGEFAPQGYAAASELAKNLTGSVRDQVMSIEVTSDGSRLSLLLIDGTEVRFGAARDLFAKLVRLETVLTTTEDREPGVIDVSTREVTL